MYNAGVGIIFFEYYHFLKKSGCLTNYVDFAAFCANSPHIICQITKKATANTLFAVAFYFKNGKSYLR